MHLDNFSSENSDLSSLPKLETLGLIFCKNFDITPLKELRKLRFARCSEISMSFLPKLKLVKIFENPQSKDSQEIMKIQDYAPLFSPNLQNLSLLNMKADNLTPLIAATNLRTLNLSGFTPNSKSIYSALSQLTALEDLNLSNTDISDLSVLEKLTNLKVLDLCGCAKIRSFDPLCKLVGLRKLICDIRHPTLVPLIGLQKLKKIKRSNSSDPHEFWL